MTHPGLPELWVLVVSGLMLLAVIWALLAPASDRRDVLVWNLASVPWLGRRMRDIVSGPWLLLSLRILMVTLFVLVIVAGLFGTPIPARNLATVLTWNLWWTGLIFSVFLLGSAWCAVCPWDALAQWLVRRRWWRRAEPNNSLNLHVPKLLRNVWPALWMFIGLTWLELGVGVTSSPYATAVLALLMVVLATTSLALFERKAFCRYFCPVGRTIGSYSQLAAVELRPIDPQVCADCTTLECYHGTEQIEPCPTWLVMGRMQQNSNCTSCGNCSQSCPDQNIAWRFRLPGTEAIGSARPRWDEAWFMIGLLALTAFHGITMMPFWETWLRGLAVAIGDSGRLISSFTLGLAACLVLFGAGYAVLVAATRTLTGGTLPYKRVFASMAFTALPLAFSYHLAHNLNHLLRENADIGSLLLNPLGTDALPLSMAERHLQHSEMWVSQQTLFAMQAGLMLFGFVVAILILRHRGHSLLMAGRQTAHWRLAPMLVFIVVVTGLHLWLLAQPMIMRM